MYMNSTAQAVDELLVALSAGIVYRRSKVPDECISIIAKYVPYESDALAEYQRLYHHLKRIGLIQHEKLSDGNTYVMLTTKGKKRGD